jgi:hypothetical protein
MAGHLVVVIMVGEIGKKRSSFAGIMPLPLSVGSAPSHFEDT